MSKIIPAHPLLGFLAFRWTAVWLCAHLVLLPLIASAEVGLKLKDHLFLQHVTGPVKVAKVMVQTCVLDVRRGTHCRTTCVLVCTYCHASA